MGWSGIVAITWEQGITSKNQMKLQPNSFYGLWSRQAWTPQILGGLIQCICFLRDKVGEFVKNNHNWVRKENTNDFGWRIQGGLNQIISDFIDWNRLVQFIKWRWLAEMWRMSRISVGRNMHGLLSWRIWWTTFRLALSRQMFVKEIKAEAFILYLAGSLNGSGSGLKIRNRIFKPIDWFHQK